MRFRKEGDAPRMELDPFHLQHISAITLQRGSRSVKMSPHFMITAPINALRALVFVLALDPDEFGHPVDSFFGFASAVLAGVVAGAPFASLLPSALSLPLPLSLLVGAAGASFFAASL